MNFICKKCDFINQNTYKCNNCGEVHFRRTVTLWRVNNKQTTIRELAERLNISTSSAYNKVVRGKFNAEKICAVCKVVLTKPIQVCFCSQKCVELSTNKKKINLNI